MASASQHRCVFVGNIPYDASEEQLIQILEEVGPVASFRLVTDKETGKPKGYGFCEYKDEETALSARRNLQGYEINGRQLRVDFAENDKNLDRTREQGRGGPGLAATIGDSSNQLQIGISAAMGAASIMAGALGGSQVGIRSNHNGQSVIGNDPLTLYLAQMSRNQLSEVLHQSKEMATQNKNLARELLVSNPHLSKALLQVLIMLRMVPLQMLQLPNMRQVSTSAPQNGQQAKVSAQAQFGLPSLPHNKLHSGVEEGQSSANAQIPLATYQSSHSHFQEPHQTQQTVRPMQSGVTTLPNLPSQQLSISSVTQQNHFAAPSPSTNQMQLHIAQISKPIESSHLHSENPVSSKASLPASFSARTELKDPRHQPGSMAQGTLRTKGQEVGRSCQMNSSGSLAQITPNLINLPQELKKSNVTPGIQEATSHPLRHVKLEDGMGSSIPMSNRPLKRVKSEDGSGVPVPVADRPLKQVKIEERINFPASMTRNSLNATASPNQNIRSVLPIEKQTPQLPPGIDPGILEQVLKLTPEQLSLLPPDQQQQVIQLQKILSNSA